MHAWVFPAAWMALNPLTNLWQSFQFVVRHHDLVPITVAILGTAAVLAAFWRPQRRHVRTVLVMYGLAFLLMLLSAVPAALGWDSAAKALHAAGLLLVGFAVVKLSSIIVFDVILCLTPLSPPQVLRDLIVAGGYMGAGVWLLSRVGVTVSSLVAT